ncbi:Uncharacterised protein [Mycobacteroides abscessus subsp. abscessus]|nr:Uncharacterised protein [Mycobacteroides abscessus subsp. abscessus]
MDTPQAVTTRPRYVPTRRFPRPSKACRTHDAACRTPVGGDWTHVAKSAMRSHAKQHGDQCAHRDRHRHRGTRNAQYPGILERVGEEHHHDDADVKVGRDGAAHHAHHHQRHGTPGCRGLENSELAHESARQGDSGERQQKQREHNAQHRRSPTDPGPPPQIGHLVVVLVIAIGPVICVARTHQTGDGERPYSAETVCRQIEQRRGDTTLVGGGYAGKQKSGMRHRRVGQHSLDIGLCHRTDRSDQHGGNGHPP